MTKTKLPVVAWRYRYIRPSGTKGVWKLVYEKGECNLTEGYEHDPLTPLHPAQEALDRAEERVRELEEQVERLNELSEPVWTGDRTKEGV